MRAKDCVEVVGSIANVSVAVTVAPINGDIGLTTERQSAESEVRSWIGPSLAQLIGNPCMDIRRKTVITSVNT